MWILVVEDEAPMRELLRQGLEEENHTITLAGDGLEAVHSAETYAFDAIVLDIAMPGIDGVEVVQRLRLAGRDTPVLILTARDDTVEVVRALDAGADDYLIKPFAFQVLLARLRAIARRARQPPKSELKVDDLVLKPASHQAWRDGVPLSLTATEYRVLEFLMRRVGHAVSRSTIIENVWGVGNDIKANTVDAFIKNLREKIDVGHGGKLIHTVRSYGYILREEL